MGAKLIFFVLLLPLLSNGQMEDCDWAQNDIGVCGCDAELFINEDCTKGFYCVEGPDNPDPIYYDGCRKRCAANELLVPHFDTGSWECVDEGQVGVSCPGKFNIRCPEDDLGIDFDSTMCDCENGQLIFSSDCRHAFYCHSRSIGGGRKIDCGPGEIVKLSPRTYQMSCELDDGKCPGGGGFKLGCFEGSPPPPEFLCEFKKNPLGVCGGCDEQLFVNSDCSESFYCMDNTPVETDGCHLKCNDGEKIYLDFVTKDWHCSVDQDLHCPGEFSIDCPDEWGNSEINCECDGQLWMNRDCSALFQCSGPKIQETGANPGNVVSCPPGRVMHIDFHNPSVYECVADKGQCPGSFHFSCDGVQVGSTTSNPMGTTSGSGKEVKLATSIIVIGIIAAHF